MKNTLKTLFLVMVQFLIVGSAMAADGDMYSAITGLGFATALCMGLCAFGGAIAQGKAAAAALEGIARNPGAQGKIFVPMIIGLALIESLVIYGLVVAFGLQGSIDKILGA